MTPPPVLAASKRWILWRFEQKPGRPKPDKVPHDVHGFRMDRHDSSKWLTFADAQAAFNRGGFDGIGFVLGGDFVGYDHDGCRDPETGVIAPDVQSIIDELDSYTEVSPSGRGIHVMLIGMLPPGRRRSDGHELYDDQFFTFTGNHVAGTPTDVLLRDRAVNQLHKRLFPPFEPRRRPSRPSGLTDDEVVDRLRGSRRAEDFCRLVQGNLTGYDSQSAADQALVNMLFYVSGDPEQVDRMFRQTALMRPKWDEQRGALTYGQRTLRSAETL